MNVSQVLELLDTVKDAEAFKKRLVELENVRQVNAAQYAEQVNALQKLSDDTHADLDRREQVFQKQMKQRALDLDAKNRKESEELNSRFSRAMAQLEDARALMAKAVKLRDDLEVREQALVELQKQLQDRAIELGTQEVQLKMKAAKIQEVIHG